MNKDNIGEFLREQRKRPLKIMTVIQEFSDYKCPECGKVLMSQRDAEPLIIYKCTNCSYNRTEKKD